MVLNSAFFKRFALPTSLTMVLGSLRITAGCNKTYKNNKLSMYIFNLILVIVYVFRIHGYEINTIVHDLHLWIKKFNK